MTIQNNDLNGCGTSKQEGYTMSYRCGDYCAAVTFDDRDCASVVSNVASFLVGCGFSPSNVIECMASTAKDLEAPWKGEISDIDPVIARKWDLFEAVENA